MYRLRKVFPSFCLILLLGLSGCSLFEECTECEPECSEPTCDPDVNTTDDQRFDV